MNEQFILKIHSVEKIDYDNLTDVIISIQWSYFYIIQSDERNAMRSMRGVYELALPDSENFVPITEVDVDVLKNWMQFGFSPHSQRLNFEAMQERLRFLMDINIRPTLSHVIEGLDRLN